jgi:pimeloyl-ACP methyl ester carboxylesterase
MIKNAIALVALGVVGLVAPASASAEPCAQATCTGELQVPLNWADPTSERIPVPYKWVSRTDRSRPSAGVIAGMAGGPSSTLSADGQLSAVLGPLMADHDMLIVERRGFGTSSPLQCPDIQIDKPETVQACAAELGPRAQFFSTDQRVADFDAVRQALGVPSLMLYGTSYGSVDVAAYASRYPTHTSAVVVDSPLMPGNDGYLTGYTYQEFLNDGQRVYADPCQASRACRAVHPDPGKELADLTRLLRAHPDPLVPLAMVDPLFRFTSAPVTGRDGVAAVSAYLKGDQAPLHRLAPRLVAGREGRDDVFRAAVAVLTYQCNDAAMPYSRSAAPDVRARQLADYRLRHPERPVTATEVGGNFEDFCLYWPTPRESPPVLPGAKFPDVPALITGGSHEVLFGESVVPLARKFPHGQSLLVPFGGHVTSLVGRPACVQEAVQSFFAGGGVRPGCTAESYRARGVFPRTSAELPRASVPGVAVAYATVSDILGFPSGPGLRGGSFTTTQEGMTLTDVRYVSDVGVSGQVRLTMANVEADVTLSTGQQLHLSWTPFQARDTVTVTGSTNGHSFEVCLPAA